MGARPVSAVVPAAGGATGLSESSVAGVTRHLTTNVRAADRVGPAAADGDIESGDGGAIFVTISLCDNIAGEGCRLMIPSVGREPNNPWEGRL